MLNIKIQRIDKTLPLPGYATSGAVAFDLYAREPLVIPAHSVARIPTNLIIEVPPGYLLYVKDRSSTAQKKGLLATAGIIDQDFCGPGNEILFQVYNTLATAVNVDRGERLAQGIFIRVDTAEWQEVDAMSAPTRGSFGSTGSHI